MNLNKPLTARIWFIILMTFVFFPVAVYGLWKNKRFNIITRIIVSLVIIYFGSNFMNNIYDEMVSENNNTGGYSEAVMENSGEIKTEVYTEPVTEATVQAENSSPVQSDAMAENPNLQEDVNTGPENVQGHITNRNVLYSYISANNIELESFSKERKTEKMLDEAFEKMSNGIYLYSFGIGVEEAFANTKKTGLPLRSTDGNSFRAGNEENFTSCDYIFYGDIDDESLTGKISGEGVIAGVTYFNDMPFVFIRYAGELKDGYFDGYGQEYYIPDRESEYDRAIADINGSDYENVMESVLSELNYIVYEGEFEKGKYSGKGNGYKYASAAERCIMLFKENNIAFDPMAFGMSQELYEKMLPNIEKNFNNVTIYTGTFADGNSDKVSVYQYGQKVS